MRYFQVYLIKHFRNFILVIESTTKQSFVTRQLIKQSSKFEEVIRYYPQIEFQNKLKSMLQDHYLRFNREKMDITALEMFVKYGLEMEDEFLDPLRKALEAAKTQNELRKDQEKDQEKNAILKDVDVIKQMTLTKLHHSYRYIYITFEINSYIYIKYNFLHI
jgi:hypothetical protein